MNQYTDYSPDLSSLDDLPVAEPAKPADPETLQRAKGRKVQKSTRRVKAKAKPEAKPKAESSSPGFVDRLYAALTSSSARMLFGIFLMCIAVYLLVSFSSYLVTCVQDQSLINSTDIGNAGKVANAGGEGGARLSEFLINECFGLGSLVIVVWFFAMSLKMLIGKPRFKSVNFTIKCLIVLITVSLIIGLMTIGVHSPVNWGGYHGRYVNEFIVNFIGWTGAVLLSIFMISLFAVICLSDFTRWIMKLRRKHLERKRAAAAEKAEREAREEEIRRMRAQEKIDDIKAGETTVIQPVNDSEAPADDNQVQFSNNDAPNDAPLYSVPDVDDNAADVDDDHSELYSAVVEDDAPEAAADPENDSGTAPAVNAEKSSDTQPQNEGRGRAMVVNVNSIGEAENKKFQTEVDIYESQNYRFPPIELLKPGKERIDVDPEEQLRNQQQIEKTLLDFGIPIKKIEATVGPTVTLYEIVPENGVKIAKIRRLVDDIALSLAALGVRIIAPIPGKGTVGIEVANKDPQTVSMRTIIKSKKFQETRYKLPIALGSTISNEVYMADLAKMPHLLVAGATGQGKSVGLNAIISSLLYCKAPWQLKFVMIDPKQVEFSLYNKLRDHYMAMIPEDAEDPQSEPVLTDMSKVEATLNSLIIEMENRYQLLKNAHTRNIEEYNDKIKDGVLDKTQGHKFLPYIVVVVDEFADLIMQLKKSVEMPIARLAQKARAVGMHVILATQRPSVDVITGIIKANFPARISFKVSQSVDSRTILDSPGAEQLIGRGDMLIFNNSEMVRVQCAFIDTPEVEEICDYVAKQPYPTGPYVLPEPMLSNSEEPKGGEVTMRERDPYFEEVARAVVSSNNASTSSIQRSFALGYNRAGRIMDQLERAHIVGPSQGGKPRAVLVDMMELDTILASL